MALDLNRIAPQASRLAARLQEESQPRAARLARAGELLEREAQRFPAFRERVRSSRAGWPLAGLRDGLNQAYPPPAPPDSFTVVGTDGSHIDIDRHRAVRCYVINIGAVRLDYGAKPDAHLENFPRVYAAPEEMAYVSPETGREIAVEGNLLSVKRAVEECRTLAELAGRTPAAMPTLALLDGSLMLWGLVQQDYPEFIWKILLEEGYLNALEALRQLAPRPLALASYISYPRSADVANTLRLALCPHTPPDCERSCRGIPREARPCDGISGILDRELFQPLLKPGERSPVFASASSVVQERYGVHRACFYYLRLEDELARVEIPAWVADAPERLSLSHALIWDQCRRGLGYPVALSEAHEQAVVNGADRDNFWHLVESALTDVRLDTSGSAKSRSKRTRSI